MCCGSWAVLGGSLLLPSSCPQVAVALAASGFQVNLSSSSNENGWCSPWGAVRVISLFGDGALQEGSWGQDSAAFNRSRQRWGMWRAAASTASEPGLPWIFPLWSRQGNHLWTLLGREGTHCH